MAWYLLKLFKWWTWQDFKVDGVGQNDLLWNGNFKVCRGKYEQ